MKLTEKYKQLLFKLVNHKLIFTSTGFESYEIKPLKIEQIVDWKTEYVPPKKGLFGHKGYIKLVEIYLKSEYTAGTNRVNTQNKNLRWYLDEAEKAFVRMQEITDQLRLFGYEIIKTAN